MSVFFFACTKQKANGKEESAKAGLVTFKSIAYLESRNPPASLTVPRRSYYQEMSYFPESISLFKNLIFRRQVNTTEETRRLSSFPQDFCSGATEKKG
jgi:hypothetical protein